VKLPSHTGARARAVFSSHLSLSLTLLVVAAAGLGGCKQPPPPTRAEIRSAWLEQRAFWDTMRVHAAVRARKRDSLHAESKLIDASIDRTRLAYIARLDSLIAAYPASTTRPLDEYTRAAIQELRKQARQRREGA